MAVLHPQGCKCKIVGQEIDFCPLHENAAVLLDQLEYVYRFLFEHQMAERGIENTKQQAILPDLVNIMRRCE